MDAAVNPASRPARPDDEARDALVARLFEAALGAFDLAALHVGERLGFYGALADGPATAAELAAATGTAPRYVREWLEQQAVTGILEVDDPAADEDRRRYALPAAHRDVLLHPESLAYMAPVARAMMGIAAQMPSLLDVFRTGAGLSWEAYGADIREAQASTNRPMFANLLGPAWLGSIPDIDARLRSDPPARVADVAVGGGWSAIAMARAYPRIRVDGLDLDPASIELARANLATTEVADRVTFETRDAADPGLAGRYDLVTIFEAVHDFSQPVAVLRAVRGLLAPGASVLVADERVAERFTAPGDAVERFMYGWSFLLCLPNGMADEPSAATGTVMRPDTLRRYASEAGFTGVEILPIEADFWRFYRLTP
jgi:2-polyprenyl-3-methyl-5-hydroxy-6-metoxy-1,4-benzoquinol methylase